MLNTKLSQKEMDEMRIGWDLVMDFDAIPLLDMDATKIIVKRVLEFLKSYGVETTSLKFSGNRGFHLMIPWESFPKKMHFTEETRKMYPELAQKIIDFIRFKIYDDLRDDLVKWKGSWSSLAEMLEGHPEEMSPYLFVDIENRWSSRHLFRLPYSINEKTGLVSVPLRLKDLKDFEKEDARPEKVRGVIPYPEIPESIEMAELIEDVDYHFRTVKEEKKKEEKKTPMIRGRIPEASFPPCIKNIMKGLNDGRKRSLFILVNFLRKANWSWEEIEKRIHEWNSKNNPPLKDNYINTQIKWFSRQNRSLLPPNCDNQHFYVDIGICTPDNICKSVKNPASYLLRKVRRPKRRRVKR